MIWGGGRCVDVVDVDDILREGDEEDVTVDVEYASGSSADD